MVSGNIYIGIFNSILCLYNIYIFIIQHQLISWIVLILLPIINILNLKEKNSIKYNFN